MKNFFLSVLTLSFSAHLSAQTITTFAGNGTGSGTMTGSYSGDGGAATAAGLNRPYGIAVDASGNVFIAEYNNNRIRKVNTSGVITTVAGNGTAGYTGDSGPATNASIKNPYGIAIDASGNLYIADEGNSVIRKVNSAGVISTFAGSPTWGYGGDGGPATLAKLSVPTGVALDGSGNVYISDGGNNRIRMVNTSGIISTVAGNGTGAFGGDGGPATAAEIFSPMGLAVDAAGNIFISDNDNYRIRKVNTSGIISTVAGNGTHGHMGDGSAATACELLGSIGLTLDAHGNIFVAEWGSDVRLISATSGIITTYAGSALIPGYSGDGGPATAARMDETNGVALDAAGNLYITDNLNHVVRKIIPSGTLGVAQAQPSSGAFTVYPNPAHDAFTVRFNECLGNVTVTVSDITGRVLETRSVDANLGRATFTTSGYSAGTYFIVVTTAEKIYREKLVVQL